MAGGAARSAGGRLRLALSRAVRRDDVALGTNFCHTMSAARCLESCSGENPRPSAQNKASLRAGENNSLQCLS